MRRKLLVREKTPEKNKILAFWRRKVLQKKKFLL